MKQMIINGNQTSGHAKEAIQIINPATEAIIDEVPRGTAGDIDTAVSAATTAFNSWKRIPAWERAGMLHEAAGKIKDHEEELARLLTEEEGKPLEENDEELFWTYDTIHYYAELGRHERGRFLPPGDPGSDQFRYQRTLWRRRLYHSLELPAPTAGLETGPSPGSRQYRRHKTIGIHPLNHPASGRDRIRPSATRCGQCRHRLWPRGW